MGIFRAAALERLSSPERLDELIHVTRPRAWISLAALGSILAVALVWGFAGHIPIEVAGSGMIVRPGGVFDVVSQGGGVVTDILVRPGDLVVAGQEIARVSQPLLAQQVSAARAAVAELERMQRVIATSQQRESVLQNAAIRQEIGTINDQITHTRAAIVDLRAAVDAATETVSITENLTAQGLTNRQMIAASRSDLLGAKLQLAAAEERLRSLQNDLQQIEIRRLTLARGRELELETIEEKLLDARSNLAQAEAQLRLTSAVVSPYDGHVVDNLINSGSIVSPGGGVISLELDHSRREEGWRAVNEAIIFVPSADAKRIRPGMQARVSPGDVSVEEYGFMVGRVQRVSKYAATSQAMMRLLSNDSIVSSLESGGPVTQVVVELQPTDANPSGYLWSSKKTPNFHIHSGTPCVGKVVTDRTRPVELVIPYVRTKLGI